MTAMTARLLFKSLRNGTHRQCRMTVSPWTSTIRRRTLLSFPHPILVGMEHPCQGSSILYGRAEWQHGPRLGTSCMSAADVGGHYFAASVSADPWTAVRYTATAAGASTRRVFCTAGRARIARRGATFWPRISILTADSVRDLGRPCAIRARRPSARPAGCASSRAWRRPTFSATRWWNTSHGRLKVLVCRPIGCFAWKPTNEIYRGRMRMTLPPTTRWSMTRMVAAAVSHAESSHRTAAYLPSACTPTTQVRGLV